MKCIITKVLLRVSIAPSVLVKCSTEGRHWGVSSIDPSHRLRHHVFLRIIKMNLNHRSHSAHFWKEFPRPITALGERRIGPLGDAQGHWGMKYFLKCVLLFPHDCTFYFRKRNVNPYQLDETIYRISRAKDQELKLPYVTSDDFQVSIDCRNSTAMTFCNWITKYLRLIIDFRQTIMW